MPEKRLTPDERRQAMGEFFKSEYHVQYAILWDLMERSGMLEEQPTEGVVKPTTPTSGLT